MGIELFLRLLIVAIISFGWSFSFGMRLLHRVSDRVVRDGLRSRRMAIQLGIHLPGDFAVARVIQVPPAECRPQFLPVAGDALSVWRAPL